MTPEQTERLISRHPKLFRGWREPAKRSLCFGSECRGGWWDLIDDLCYAIERLAAGRDEYPLVQQVKEKFGGLRFYAINITPEMDDEISKAETASYKVCEMCGKPGKPRTGGWIVTRCDECLEVL